MSENYIREKANCLRNEMNHFWTGMFVTGGGAIGFTTITEKNVLIFIYIFLGVLLSIVFFNAYMLRRNQLIEITKTLFIQGDKNGKNLRYIE